MKCLIIKIYILLILMFQSIFAAQSIDISKNKEISILKYSDIYIDTKGLTLKQIIQKKLFSPYKKEFINTGMQKVNIWVHFKLENSSNKSINKILIISSPILETISLYKESNLTKPHNKGVSNLTKEHYTLLPFYHISLAPYSSKIYYLKVNSLLTPVDFSLKITNLKDFEYKDRNKQFINILLIGFVLALMLYSFILFFYTKDKSYLFYSFYLLALIYQQFTYLGLTQIYMPLEFINFDMHIPVFKVNILIITAALFAMSFLKTKTLPYINKIYQYFIAIAILEIIFLSHSKFYNLYIVIITGALFIIFNLFAGIVAYKKSNKQARLFIVGFSIVFVSYFLLILDALAVSTIIQKYPNILMFTTAFEALILSLAFADRYLILQKEKAFVDAQILQESKQRADIIKKEVIKKTKALNSALKTKELLLKEVHHRVKNNLQIILSIIRLQQDEIEDKKIYEKFIDLENRINAISKTYNMLLINDKLEEIDMQEYIEALVLDIKETLHNSNQKIDIKTDISAKLPLRESVYLGLIINELVTNSFKYAFKKDGVIYISLKQYGKNYTLEIKDNGKGYNLKETKESLGLKLIHTLIFEQLNGTLEKETKNYAHYIIRFSI